MSQPRILVFGGSLRAESYNQKLATIAAAGAREAGGDVTLISLRDFRLPLFDEDLEEAEGKSEAAKKLKELFLNAEGFIIASPEYNSGVTGALKNAIDWVSRADSEDEPPLLAYKGKTAAILSASPGGYGGARSLAQLRPLLENINVTVLPDQVTVPKAYEAFDAAGNLIDPALQAAVKVLAASLVAKLA
ncbi:MAG: NAD(P)H-dependent oxidoreductase [Verrucomicrobiota bacterium]